MTDGTQPLQMGELEICNEFKTAANKGKKIEILAEMNLCEPRTIAEILHRHGLELPKLWAERLKTPARTEPTASPVRGITIGTLIELLSDLPPETPVLLDTNTTLRWVTVMREYSADSGAAHNTAILKG